MANLVDKIGSIERRIGKLLQVRDSLKRENQDLVNELSARGKEIAEMQGRIDSLKKDNQSLRSANALLGSKDYKRETKFKINSLIREIDQCIGQLSE